MPRPPALLPLVLLSLVLPPVLPQPPPPTLLRPHELTGRHADVLVYGGTPQAVTTAVAAAREGERVVLVTPTGDLGGVLTTSGLSTLDMSHEKPGGGRPRGQLLTRGLFTRFWRGVGRRVSVDVTRAERVLWRMTTRAGVRVVDGASLADLTRRGPTLTAVRLTLPGGRSATLSATTFVDATDTADLARRSGAAFTRGRADTGLDDRTMAATVVFALDGVNWREVGRTLKGRRREVGAGSGADAHSAWGYLEVTRHYRPSDPTRFWLRGLNLARQDGGTVFVNALLLYGVDGTDPRQLARARVEGAREARRVAAFLRQRLPREFGRSSFRAVAPAVYVRETGHLRGLYRLTARDVVTGRRFEDRVALGAYAMDGQAYRPEEGPLLMGRPRSYSVPLRSLVPLGATNLLVVSQAASFDAIAAFSARTAPLQMTLGEAAGTAAAVARTSGVSVADVARSPTLVREVQRRLRARGAKLDAPTLGRGEAEDDLPGAAQAWALHERGVFPVPASIEGGLGLRYGMLRRNFVQTLRFHDLATHGHAPSPALPTLLRVADTPFDSPLLTVREARALLRGYARDHGLTLRLPDLGVSEDAVITRGQAAIWLTAALKRP